MSWRPLARVLAVMLTVGGAVMALPGVLGGILAMNMGVADRTVEQRVSVGDTPTLTVDTSATDLEIDSGPPGTIDVRNQTLVRAVNRAQIRPFFAATPLRVEGGGEAVKAEVSDRISSDPSLLLPPNGFQSWRITVPPQTHLVLTGSGGVKVHGISGDIDVSLRGGLVTLSGITVRGLVRVRDAESIYFDGTLDRGALDLAAPGGYVRVRLPASTDAHLTARSVADTVRVSDYFVHQGAAGSGSGFASGDLGSGGPGSIAIYAASAINVETVEESYGSGKG